MIERYRPKTETRPAQAEAGVGAAIELEYHEDGYPKLPDFLNRKLNPGDNRGPPPAPRPRRAKAPKVPDDAEQIYLNNKWRGLTPGFHYVTDVRLTKAKASFRPAGKGKMIHVQRSLWDKLVVVKKGE